MLFHIERRRALQVLYKYCDLGGGVENKCLSESFLGRSPFDLYFQVSGCFYEACKGSHNFLVSTRTRKIVHNFRFPFATHAIRPSSLCCGNRQPLIDTLQTDIKGKGRLRGKGVGPVHITYQETSCFSIHIPKARNLDDTAFHSSQP